MAVIVSTLPVSQLEILASNDERPENAPDKLVTSLVHTEERLLGLEAAMLFSVSRSSIFVYTTPFTVPCVPFGSPEVH